MIVKLPLSPATNAEVLVTLAVLLGASVATFWALVRRWESHRQWHALAEWAAERKLRFRSVERHGVPPILNALSEHSPVVRLYLADEATLLLQFQTPPKHAAGDLTFSSAPAVWNILVRRLGATWHPTGLRPSSARSSILDLFSLSGFPLLGTTERFTVYGTDSIAARTLSGSMTRSLLPPDVGLLLRDEELVLDFSDRPFDQIELDRMLALANQVAEKLPDGA
jgi:hypothetical protein